jgi:acyl carrier protein
MHTISEFSEQLVQSELIKIIAEIKDCKAGTLSLDTLLRSDDASMPSLDFDSLDAFELATAVEEVFGLQFDEDMDLTRLKSLIDVSRFVFSELQSNP